MKDVNRKRQRLLSEARQLLAPLKTTDMHVMETIAYRDEDVACTNNDIHYISSVYSGPPDFRISTCYKIVGDNNRGVNGARIFTGAVNLLQQLIECEELLEGLVCVDDKCPCDGYEHNDLGFDEDD